MRQRSSDRRDGRPAHPAERALRRVHVFFRRDAANRRFAQARVVGNIFENHRFEIIDAFFEEIVLPLDYRFGDAINCSLALLQRAQEPPRTAHFIADIARSIGIRRMRSN